MTCSVNKSFVLAPHPKELRTILRGSERWILRLVINYREFNKKTVNDEAGLKMFHQLHQAKVFSKLDRIPEIIKFENGFPMQICTFRV